jgi:hypothetical protein
VVALKLHQLKKLTNLQEEFKISQFYVDKRRVEITVLRTREQYQAPQSLYFWPLDN